MNLNFRTTFLWVALVAMLGLSGCARNYVVTLNNGSQLGATGKPRLENGAYTFKDALGQEMVVPVGRVREIAPASMSGGSQFRSSGR